MLGYGGLWVLGFAEHDGILERIPRWTCAIVAAVLAPVGLILQLTPMGEDKAMLNQGTIGFVLWSGAFVLILLRWRPRMAWVRSLRWLDRTVTVVNARAVTIYLWHEVAIVATAAMFSLAGLGVAVVLQLPVVLVLTAIVVLAMGWVEDLAARRPVALIPRGKGAAARRRAALDHLQTLQDWRAGWRSNRRTGEGE
jgi:hypothetical protein